MKPKKTNQRSPKRRRAFKKKAQPYRIRNWKEYNAALVARGSLTIWLDDAACRSWLNDGRSGQRGASNTYSDVAIETAWHLKVVYHQTLRGTQGLLASVLQLLGVDLPVPDYSTLARRASRLNVRVAQRQRAVVDSGQPIHLVVDATGCKIYGEGEWKVRQHGISKRRTWRKLHLGINEATGEILAAVVTTNDVSDGAVLADLLEQVEAVIGQVSGDGGYDRADCYEAIAARAQRQGQAIRVTIPPRRNARIQQHGNSHAPPLARDENLRRIRAVGRAQWKRESGYHRRSLAATGMFREKTIFGEKLSSRGFDNQATEAFIRCLALNRMTQLGMPQSYRV